MEKAEEHLKHEIEQHQAHMRRSNIMLWKQAKLQQLNKRKVDKSTKTMQNKHKLDFQQKQESYKLRCDNEETLLIRRVYEALLREMVKFRREEKKQEKQFASLKLKELEQQLQVRPLFWYSMLYVNMLMLACIWWHGVDVYFCVLRSHV